MHEKDMRGIKKLETGEPRVPLPPATRRAISSPPSPDAALRAEEAREKEVSAGDSLASRARKVKRKRQGK